MSVPVERNEDGRIVGVCMTDDQVFAYFRRRGESPPGSYRLYEELVDAAAAEFDRFTAELATVLPADEVVKLSEWFDEVASTCVVCQGPTTLTCPKCSEPLCKSEACWAYHG